MSDEQSNPPTHPPDWYPDPAGEPLERWWDGAGWTDHTRPLTAAPLPPPPSGGLRCLVCHGTEFQPMNYMLNTQGLTLLGWDGFNRTAACQVCRSCGFIHWFAQLN